MENDNQGTLETEPEERPQPEPQPRPLQNSNGSKVRRTWRWAWGNRDTILELIIIGLILSEIRIAIQGGNDELNALNTLNSSIQTTANTMSSISQEQQQALEQQKETGKTISQLNEEMQNQLTVLKAQQSLVAKQLGIQQTVFEKQQRRPEVELWARTWNLKTGTTLIPLNDWSNGMSGPIGATRRFKDDTLVDLAFVVRNIGSDDLINLVITPRVPSTVVISCVNYNPLNGELPDTCAPPVSRLSPIHPGAKGTRSKTT